MNLARLNHILIPSTRDGRERIRRSLVGRAAAPFWWLYAALSDEGRTLSVLMLFIGTAGLSVDTTLIYVLWSALVGLVIAGICVRPAFHMRGISLDARAPHRVAVGEAATFELVLTNSSRAPIHDVRIAGPFLPWDGHWVARSPSVAVIPQGGSARVEARARFVARGEHRLVLWGEVADEAGQPREKHLRRDSGAGQGLVDEKIVQNRGDGQAGDLIA